MPQRNIDKANTKRDGDKLDRGISFIVQILSNWLTFDRLRRTQFEGILFWESRSWGFVFGKQDLTHSRSSKFSGQSLSVLVAQRLLSPPHMARGPFIKFVDS
jgi:hypothetical protein